MSGKQPSTIFTDQDVAISKAIKMVLPNTCHRLCLWHIFHNATLNLGHAIPEFSKFLIDFKRCVYENYSVNKFERRWVELLDKYRVNENPWLANLFNIREKWATVYRHDSFCVDMTTTQRSESMNN